MKIPSYRIGNDIPLRWDIFRPDNSPESFDGKSLNFFISRLNGDSTEIYDFSVDGNSIVYNFRGKDQKFLGIYFLTLVENQGKPNMATVDRTAFELIANSELAQSADSDTLHLEVLQLSDSLSFDKINMSKEEIEAELVGDILSHNHDSQIRMALQPYAKSAELPTKLSQFSNDVPFLTEHQDISGKANNDDIPTNVSQLNNDLGFTSIPKSGFLKDWITSFRDVRFNEQSEFYEIGTFDKNKIGEPTIYDATESDMLTIIQESFAASTPRYWERGMNFACQHSRARAFINILGNFFNGGGQDYNNTFQNSAMEYINFAFYNSARIRIGRCMFTNCTKLKKIANGLDFFYLIGDTSNIFTNCPKLEYVHIINLKTNISIPNSPNLGKESILFLIKNSIAESEITIKLHPTAYDMAMADADIQQALAEKTFVSLAK